MERLRLVEAKSVGGSELISVGVLFCAPARTIPVLSIGSVTTSQLIQGLFLEVSILAKSRLSLQLGERESGLVLKPSYAISSSKSRMRLSFWRNITGTIGGSKVIGWVVERVRFVSSLSSITTRE